jgi:tetratricopeptide (TPR) repeat protein
VDKIPASGSITQVLMANTALTQFSKSIDLKPTWIALYTRGNSYLYWPKIFGRAQMGVDDLEKAYAIQKKDSKRSYHVRVYISLGDGYWKTEKLDKAIEIWKEGAAAFPDNQGLKDRLAKKGDDLEKYINDVLDPNKRVDTDLKELWRSQQ